LTGLCRDASRAVRDVTASTRRRKSRANQPGFLFVVAPRLLPVPVGCLAGELVRVVLQKYIHFVFRGG